MERAVVNVVTVVGIAISIHFYNKYQFEIEKSEQRLKQIHQLEDDLESAKNEVKDLSETLKSLNEELNLLRQTNMMQQLKFKETIINLEKERSDEENKLREEFRLQLMIQKESIHEESHAWKVDLVWMLDCLSQDDVSYIPSNPILGLMKRLIDAVAGSNKATRCMEAFKARYQNRLN